MKKLLLLILFFPILTHAQGIMTTIAGNGTAGHTGDSGIATVAEIYNPVGVCMDPMGNIFFVDGNNNVIRKITASTGIINTIAGTGSIGCTGEGIPATNATLLDPAYLCVDSAGNIYFTDQGCEKVRKIDAVTGIITTIAGNGSSGYSGDSMTAISATFDDPLGICLDAYGNIYVADGGNHVIRKITVATGIITTIAGNGVGAGMPTGSFSGEEGPATSAGLNHPLSVFIDSSGNLYIGDYSNFRIRKVEATTGIITTVAGNGTYGISGDGGLATDASLGSIFGICVDRYGNIYMSDVTHNICRKINAATGIIQLFAGDSLTSGYSGDGGFATSETLYNPEGICLNPANGDVYISDATNNRIRKVTQPGFILTTDINNVKPSMQISIYPNPSHGKFTIQTGVQPNTNVEISNTLGQIIYTCKIAGLQNNIDISNQPAGIYFIKIDGISVRKFIKE